MKTFKEIKELLVKYRDELRQKYSIEKIGIFGSYIRDEQRKRSDVDILVEFSEGAKITLLDFIHIENYLTDLLGVKVDLVEKCVLKPRIGKHILREVSYL